MMPLISAEVRIFSKFPAATNADNLWIGVNIDANLLQGFPSSPTPNRGSHRETETLFLPHSPLSVPTSGTPYYSPLPPQNGYSLPIQPQRILPNPLPPQPSQAWLTSPQDRPSGDQPSLGDGMIAHPMFTSDTYGGDDIWDDEEAIQAAIMVERQYADGRCTGAVWRILG